MVSVPQGLDRQRLLGPDWAEWLERLPRMADDVLADWELAVAGEARYGYCSLVLPVHTPEGARAALKLTFDGDDESLHEALALKAWAGRGAVRVHRVDPARRALLLEWLHGPDLAEEWDVEACEVVAGLYRHLHVPALPQLQLLTEYVERWADGLASLGRDVPIPRRLVEQCLSLARDFVDDPDSTGTLVHGDLHYANVLAAEREPWLAIDPKPVSGDSHYELAPMLWNRMDELEATTAVESVRDGLRRRFHTLVDVADLDEHRARDWVVVRLVLNASWTVHDARQSGRRLDEEEKRWLTRCITAAKAVQD